MMVIMDGDIFLIFFLEESVFVVSVIGFIFWVSGRLGFFLVCFLGSRVSSIVGGF